jgi:radical SAM superfamily enzyme YgiQ (UPF0313 family)
MVQQENRLKITLIFPNYIIRDKFGDPSDPPLGIAYIAAVLRQKKFDVDIIDANAENLSLDQIYSRLIQFEPGIVAISCNYSPLHNPTLQIAEMVKSKFNIPVIIGGNHATAMAERMLIKCPSIDYVVCGEGETIVPQLINALIVQSSLKDVLGIVFRDGNSIIRTSTALLISDLDQLPLPAYDLLPMDKYRRYNVITSRGCPFNCCYCASNVIFKRKIRYRSPKNVVDEIEHLIKHYGHKHFWFSDDTFTTNIQYTSSFLDEIIKRNIDITWSCLTRVDVVTKYLLQKMKSAGCSYISYGIESGNQEILNKIGKNITIKEILSTLKMTYEVGIRQYGFFVVGFPGENWDSIMDDYKLIAESKLDGVAFNILIPLPGTKLMEELINSHKISLDEIKWDYLFARTPDEAHESYSANLAARWTNNLSGRDLIESCIIGHHLPKILKYIQKNK